jgi:hypothetical protein
MQRMPRPRTTPRARASELGGGHPQTKNEGDVGRGMHKPDSFKVRGALESPYRVLKAHPNNTSF